MADDIFSAPNAGEAAPAAVAEPVIEPGNTDLGANPEPEPEPEPAVEKEPAPVDQNKQLESIYDAPNAEGEKPKPGEEEKPAEKPIAKEVEKPEKQAAVQEVKDYFNTKGADGKPVLDAERLDTALNKPFPKIAEPKAEVPKAEIKPEEPPKDPIDLQFEQEDAYEKDLRQMPNDIMDSLDARIAEGVDPRTALNNIRDDVEKLLDKQFRKWKSDQSRERTKQEAKDSIKNKDLLAQQQAMTANFHTLKAHMGIDDKTFNTIVYDHNYAGQDLKRLLGNLCPDLKTLTGEAYLDKARPVLAEFASDPANAQWIMEMARMRLSYNTQDDQQKLIRAGKSKAAKTRAAASINTKNSGKAPKPKQKPAPANSMSSVLDEMAGVAGV